MAIIHANCARFYIVEDKQEVPQARTCNKTTRHGEYGAWSCQAALLQINCKARSNYDFESP